MSNTTVQHRRELGLVRSRRPGNLLLALGVGMLLVAAFLIGRGDDESPAREAGPTTSSAVRDEPTSAARTASVDVPEGYHGLAITLPFTAAGGGYVAAGDRVDIHAVGSIDGATVSSVLLPAVLVLDVSAEVDARVASDAAERPSLGQITYLLAVPLDEVDALLAATQSQGLYISLPALGEPSGSGATSPTDEASAEGEDR